MKLQGIKPISTLGKCIEKKRIEKHIQKVDKLVDIAQVTKPDIYNELYNARETLANYAKANKVRFKFSTYLNRDNLLLISLLQKNKPAEFEIVLADAKATHLFKKKNTRLLTNKEGLDYLGEGTIQTEDNFIRNVYRTVGNMLGKNSNHKY